MSFANHPLTASLFDQVLGNWAEDLDEGAVETALSRAGEVGLFAPIYRYLRWRGAPTVPGASDRWRRHIARIAMLRHEVEALAHVLEDCRPIFLKGDLLSETLYGDRFSRESGDIDLLIDPSQVGEVLTRLAARGYQPEKGVELMPWVANQYPVYHEKTGMTVELHWAITYPYIPSPAITRIMADHRGRPRPGSLACTLDRELLFLHLCYHFQQHSGFLKGLVDIAGWIDRFDDEADLQAIGQLARELGVYGLIQWPLHALYELTGRKSALYDPCVDPFIKTWAAWTSSSARGALSGERPISDASVLAFKTQNMSSVHKMLWVLAGMTTLDGLPRKASGLGWMIFRDPLAIAAAEGKLAPDGATYLKMALRPGLLAKKQINEWLTG